MRTIVLGTGGVGGYFGGLMARAGKRLASSLAEPTWTR